MEKRAQLRKGEPGDPFIQEFLYSPVNHHPYQGKLTTLPEKWVGTEHRADFWLYAGYTGVQVGVSFLKVPLLG